MCAQLESTGNHITIILTNFIYLSVSFKGVVGWCDGAGRTSSAGYSRITVGQGPTALAVGASGDCLDIFTLIYPFFPLSASVWESARYRQKYCLNGPSNPKPTNQCFVKAVIQYRQ